MPSPIGHALAGAAIAFGSAPAMGIRSPSNESDARRLRILTLVAAALAALPDIDLAAPYTHRTITHSLVATAVMTIIAAVVTGQVTKRFVWRTTMICAAAYASHLLLDWLAVDDVPPRGLQILWPFSDRWFISDWDLFRGTARREIFSAASMRANVLAVAQEIATLGPIAALAWLVGVKASTRLSPEVSGRHHPAE
jgi:LexA-binding, inner membrane-associated putative hydrolase